jgi:phage gp29-like protein
MSWTRTIVNAVRGRGRPAAGRIILPRKEDSVRDYPSAGLTPSKLAAILREADDGSLATAMELFEQMEEKDAHLYSIANTRRLALTGLEWQIAAHGTGSEAREAADYCREALQQMEHFDEVLQHLALAVGRNIAVAEIIWDVADGELRPVDLAAVDFTRIVFGDFDRPRLLTAAEPRNGVELPPHKFIVHTPHSVSGHAQRGGLLRVTAMAYLAKNLSLKDWMIFAEVFGMPVRIARYEPSASAEEKKELLAMLESLGSNAAGIFSRAVELQILEANRGTVGPPYERLIDFLNREMSKAWLGQTLTTDITGQSGSIAASRVHEQVRQDILADDVRKEGRTVRRDLLTPMTRLRFGPKAPVPHFTRRPARPANTRELADVLSVAVNQLGARVPAAWAHEALGIPQADAKEPLLPGPEPVIA